MIFVALAWGFCAYTTHDMAYVGLIAPHDGVPTCEFVFAAGGDPGADGGVEIDGHQVEVLWLGNEEAEVTIDGKMTKIGPRT